MRLGRDEQAFAEALEGKVVLPGEMARLAGLARALERVRPVGPQPDFRNALRNRIIAEAALRRGFFDRLTDAWAERERAARRSFRFVFANAAAALVLLAGGSIFAVASTSVPGDALYPVKRAREEARLLVLRASTPRAFYELDLAAERLDEIRELVARGQRNTGPYLIALNDMDAKTLDATTLLIEVYGTTRNRRPLDRLTSFTEAQRTRLERLVERMPAGAQPPARDSLDILQRIQDRVSGILSGCPCPANPLVPFTGGGSGPPPTESSNETPLCPCARFRGDNDADQGAPPPPPPPPPDGGGEQPPEEPPPPGLIDSVTNTVNDLIDQVISSLPPLPIVGQLESPAIPPPSSVVPVPLPSPL